MRHDMIVSRLGPYRVIDLSTRIKPVKTKRICDIERFLQPETQDYHSRITLESHLGTHIEAPFHFRNNWPDILDMPLTAYMGRAVLLQVATGAQAPITCEALKQAAADCLQPGDIAVLDSLYHSELFENRPDDKRARLEGQAAIWLAQQKVKCVAFGNGVSIEHDAARAGTVHDVLLGDGILLLEGLRNLEALLSDIFLMIYQPLPIAGLDASPVRAFAIEGVPGFHREGKETVK